MPSLISPAPALNWQRTPSLSANIVDTANDSDIFSDSSDEEEESAARKVSPFDSDSSATDSVPTIDAKRPCPSENTSQVDDSNAEGELRKTENRFLHALMEGVKSYSLRLRTPLTKLEVPAVSSDRVARAHEMVDWSHEAASDEEPQSPADESIMPDFSEEQALRLIYRPHGRWAAYANLSIKNPKIVTTLNAGAMSEAFIKEGTIGDSRVTYISKTWNLAQSWKGFFSELALYAEPRYLRDLQGDVIPFIIGVYLMEGKIHVAMDLPHSSFWVEASEDMPDIFKRKCIAAFDRIHARGVLHNDVELRHMLISADGNVMIIDFQRSRALVANQDLGLESCTEEDIRMEKRKIKFKLNFEDAVEREVSKRCRVLQRRERNAERRFLQQERKLGRCKVPISDIEEDDPDDIVNPIVESREWQDCWVGHLFQPSCVVVPGQDVVALGATLRKFVSSVYLAAPPSSRQGATESKSDPTGSPNPLKRKYSADVSENSAWTLSAVPPPDAQSTVPLSSKRKRALAIPDYKCQSPIAPRRRKVSKDNAASTLGSSIEESTTQDDNVEPWMAIRKAVRAPSDRLASVGSSSAFLEQSSGPVAKQDASCSAVQVPHEGTSPQPMPSFVLPSPSGASIATSSSNITGAENICVPYEGYSRAGGLVVPNQYSDQELAWLRRIWIRQDNVARCREEGLEYPLAQRVRLPASKNGIGGSKTSVAGVRWIVSRGSLKRARDDREDPDRALADSTKKKARYVALRDRGELDDGGEISGDTPLEDGPDNARVPRILSMRELEAREAARIPRAPRRSILRRKLTDSERKTQREFEEKQPEAQRESTAARPIDVSGGTRARESFPAEWSTPTISNTGSWPAPRGSVTTASGWTRDTQMQGSLVIAASQALQLCDQSPKPSSSYLAEQNYVAALARSRISISSSTHQSHPASTSSQTGSSGSSQQKPSWPSSVGYPHQPLQRHRSPTGLSAACDITRFDKISAGCEPEDELDEKNAVEKLIEVERSAACGKRSTIRSGYGLGRYILEAMRRHRLL